MDALKLIPQLFFDLIARVVPGAVGLALLVWISVDFDWMTYPDAKLIMAFEDIEFGFFGPLCLTFVLGHLLAPLGKTLSVRTSKQRIEPEWRHYDWLRVHQPDAGALAAKIRAEYTMYFSLAAAFFVALAGQILVYAGSPFGDINWLKLTIFAVLGWLSLIRGHETAQTFSNSVDNLYAVSNPPPAPIDKPVVRKTVAASSATAAAAIKPTERPAMPASKRLVFCFDGTWNRLDATTPTNVVLTAESILPTGAKGTAQLIFYDEGVGTGRGERWTGGLLGEGVDAILADAYRFLIFNYEPHDDIFVFGFSRGAYTARSFVGLIRNCGIVEQHFAGKAPEAVRRYRERDHAASADTDAMLRFRQQYSPHICVSPREDQWRVDRGGYFGGSAPLLNICYLGIWDTVGALGVPEYFGAASRWANRDKQFHDTGLTQRVLSARHAVAIDERRRAFKPSLWDNLDTMNELRGYKPGDADAPYQQKWFPGTHGSVGGGGERRGLSDQALDWVWDGARHAGLELDSGPNSPVAKLAPSAREALTNMPPPAKPGLLDRLMAALPTADRSPGPQVLHELSVSAKRRWHEAPGDLPERRAYRPPTLHLVADALDLLSPAGVGLTPENDGVVTTGFQLHEIAAGEDLRAVATKYYGDASRADAIYDANRNKLSDPTRIYDGVMLRIPDTVDGDTAARVDPPLTSPPPDTPG